MKRVLAVIVMSFVGLISAPWARSARADEQQKPCIFYWGESRYVLGYDHIVHVVNQCTVEAACTLVTNVNRTPEQFTVQPGEHRQITTWRGSPSSYFIIYLTCNLASAEK
jgi:hypothetical protein